MVNFNKQMLSLSAFSKSIQDTNLLQIQVLKIRSRFIVMEDSVFYDLFNIKPNLEDDHWVLDVVNLKSSYRKLMIKVHPDKCDHPLSTKASQILTAVYRILSDPRQEFVYRCYGQEYLECQFDSSELSQVLSLVQGLDGASCLPQASEILTPDSDGSGQAASFEDLLRAASYCRQFEDCGSPDRRPLSNLTESFNCVRVDAIPSNLESHIEPLSQIGTVPFNPDQVSVSQNCPSLNSVSKHQVKLDSGSQNSRGFCLKRKILEISDVIDRRGKLRFRVKLESGSVGYATLEEIMDRPNLLRSYLLDLRINRSRRFRCLLAKYPSFRSVFD